jgi:hypothetical protein
VPHQKGVLKLGAQFHAIAALRIVCMPTVFGTQGVVGTICFINGTYPMWRYILLLIKVLNILFPALDETCRVTNENDLGAKK